MRGRNIESGPCSWEEFRYGRDNLKLSGEEVNPTNLYTWVAAFKNGAYKYPAIVFGSDNPDKNTGIYPVNFEIKEEEKAVTLAESDSFFWGGMYMREKIKDGEHGIHTPTLILPQGEEGIGGLVLTGYFKEPDEDEPVPTAEATVAEEAPMPPTEEFHREDMVGVPQDRRELIPVGQAVLLD